MPLVYLYGNVPTTAYVFKEH